MFPQVIVHETPLNFYQIVWLKLECPKTLKGLCIDFFLEVDRLLGTNYQKYANANNSIETMLAYMVQVARLHYIGSLVIDEVQVLRSTKAGGAASILDFFVNLVNKIGIPVVFIGNMKALNVLQSEFSQARRGSGQGDMVWKRSERNEEWDILIEGMWNYQWTKKEIPLTEEIKDTIYEESQGIIDIASKLYALSQRHVIHYGSEIITPRVISMVSKTYLNLVQEAIEKLKAGEEIEIPNYEDFSPKVLNKDKEKPLKTNNQKFNGFIKKDTKQKKSISILEQVISALENVELSSEEAKQIALEVLSKKEDISLDDAIRNAIILALKLKSQMKLKVVDNETTPQRVKNKEKILVDVNPDGIRAIINRGREKDRKSVV
jgi:hypothetical protein